MTKKAELYDVCDKINLSKLMQGVYLKVERENNCFYVRIYKGESCQNTLFGGGTAREMLESLRAFRKGLLFVGDYVGYERLKDIIY